MLDTPLILGTLVAVQMFYGPGVDDGPGVGDDFRPAHGPDADVDDGPGVRDDIAGTAGLIFLVGLPLAPRK